MSPGLLQQPPGRSASAVAVRDHSDVASACGADCRNVHGLFQLAVRLHHEGEHRAAEPVYQRILAAEPAHIDTLHLLGVLYHQLGDDDRAIAYLNRAVALHGGEASFYRHLGEAYRALRRFDEAIASFQRALTLQPDDADSICDLGHALLQQGRFGEAEACYRRVAAVWPDDSEILTHLGNTLASQHRIDEAKQSFQRALAASPANAEARHMLAAVNGDRVSTAPRAYVTNLFDQYAASFDAELVGRLAYRVPQLLRAAVDEVGETADTPWRIADLGCGTGLCGEQFRALGRLMIGVDLSPKMIEHARRRGVYDRLIVDDLLAALTPDHAPFDLIIAGDVFIYVGDLETVFARVGRSVPRRGLFAFSTEHHDGGDYHLRPTGRFAHSPTYIRSLADAHQFEIRRQQPVAVRHEAGSAIHGHLYVLRRAI